MNILRILAAVIFLMCGVSNLAAVEGNDSEGGRSKSDPERITLKQLYGMSNKEIVTFFVDFDEYQLGNNINTSALALSLMLGLKDDRKGTIRLVNVLNRARSTEERRALIKAELERQNRFLELAQNDRSELYENSPKGPGSLAAYILLIRFLGYEYVDKNIGNRTNLTGEEDAWEDALAETSKREKVAISRIDFLKAWLAAPHVVIE